MSKKNKDPFAATPETPEADTPEETTITATIASPKKWDGASVYKECKEQDVFPSFESGNFIGYIHAPTGKVVSTSMPTMSAVLYESYKKAESEAVEKAKKKAEAAKPKPEKAPKAPKEPKAAKEPKEGRGRKPAFDKDAKITVVSEKNPRRPGCPGHASFEVYKNGMTVAEYLDTPQGETCHLRWDVDHGFITLA